MEEDSQGPDYKKLAAWAEACDLAVSVYLVCRAHGARLDDDIIHQLRCSAVSIPSNIAEGNAKGSNRDTLKFLYIARGSLAELETQLLICIKAGFLKEPDVLIISERCNRVGRLLGGLIRYRKSRPD
jgi:four helix bundle protein